MNETLYLQYVAKQFQFVNSISTLFGHVRTVFLGVSGKGGSVP